MAKPYTDVDLMLFKRWDEVKALTEALMDLVDRMQEVTDVTLRKVAKNLAERDLSCEFDIKRPSIWLWKKEWETRTSKEPGIYLQLFDFAPAEYSKNVGDAPSMWLMTDDFSKLRMRESADDFGRVVRAALSPELLTKWSHDDADLSESPLGRECNDVSESDRVRLMADPDALGKFILERADEFMELVPAIGQALQKMTRR